MDKFIKRQETVITTSVITSMVMGYCIYRFIYEIMVKNDAESNKAE
jgi:prolipoprotein diacylglyceryltransferase